MNIKQISGIIFLLFFSHNYGMKPGYYMTKNKKVRNVIELIQHNKATQADIDNAEIPLQAMENANKKTGYNNRHTEQLRKDFDQAKRLFRTKFQATNTKNGLELIKKKSTLTPALKKRLPTTEIPRIPYALTCTKAKTDCPLAHIQELNTLINQTETVLNDVEGLITAKLYKDATEKLYELNFHSRFDAIRKMVAIPSLQSRAYKINKDLRKFSRRVQRIEQKLAV